LKISILTPSYNSVKTIDQTIKSVQEQDYSDWEHIVVDGGSKDGTVEILKKYLHLKWISEPDRGQADAMNKAFALSTGEIIGYLNADDTYEKDLFKRVSRYFSENPDKKILIGNLMVNDGRQEVMIRPSLRLQKILEIWPCRFPLNSLSYFYKREVQERIGKFPVDLHYTMDYWFLLRVYKTYAPGYLDLPFGTFNNFNNKSSEEESVKGSLRKVRNFFLIQHPVEGLKYLKLRWHRKFYL